MQPAQDPYIRNLFDKLVNNECSPEEVDEIICWLSYPENAALAHDLIESRLRAPVEESSIDEEVRLRLAKRLESILEGDAVRTKRTVLFSAPIWRAAAAILLLLAAGSTYFIFNKSHNPPAVAVGEMKNDKAPGSNGAVLTLSDGRQVVLEDATEGVIAKEGNIAVNLVGGSLKYEQREIMAASRRMYNTMTTAKGRQYQLLLSDGTKVWMNAASSIRFPTSFSAGQREVEVSGQLYFEVAKDPHAPFIVKVADHPSYQTRVLGTQFDIMAYGDEENIETTLVEGSVQVSNKDGSVVLVPGKQARVDYTDDKIKVEEVDAHDIASWKDGFIHFDNLDLRAIMRQLSRWYDIDVKYEGQYSKRSFGGLINRNVNLSQMLNILRANGISARLEGRTVIVSDSLNNK